MDATLSRHEQVILDRDLLLVALISVMSLLLSSTHRVVMLLLHHGGVVMLLLHHGGVVLRHPICGEHLARVFIFNVRT